MINTYLKYTDAVVTLREIPDEISLCINISNCPCNCKGCHSSYLAGDVGTELTPDILLELIKQNDGITCVSFMGGDSSPEVIYTYAKCIRLLYPKLNIAWYSGRKELPEMYSECNRKLSRFDYIKLGPYIPELGGLDSPSTNQKLYKVYYEGDISDWVCSLQDITYKFLEAALI